MGEINWQKKREYKKVDIVERKGGPFPKEIKAHILQELTKIVESGQILGVTQQQLAKEIGAQLNINIRRATIGSLLDEVYRSIPPEDIEHTRVKIQVMFDRLFREAQKMINTASNAREKKEAIDLLLRCMDKFTDFLERFFIKEKPEDKLHVTGAIAHLNINLEEKSKELLKDL